MKTMDRLIQVFAILGFVYTVIGIPGLVFILLAIKKAETRED